VRGILIIPGLPNWTENTIYYGLKKSELCRLKESLLMWLPMPFFWGLFFQVIIWELILTLKGLLFLALLSFGMLVGTFIYVAGDSLVSNTLLAHNFTGYPHDCREKRQEAKAWIIPIAAVLDTLLFSCSVTLLAIHRLGGSLDVLKGNTVSSILIPLIVFFIGIFFMVFTLKKNSGAVYTS
jgi:hypothetical protein